MINETIQNTLTYESVTQITNQPEFILSIVAVWLLPLIIYFIVGAFARARSGDGRVLSKRMIEYPNFWYSFFIWFFLQAGLILTLIIFPLWIKLIN